MSSRKYFVTGTIKVKCRRPCLCSHCRSVTEEKVVVLTQQPVRGKSQRDAIEAAVDHALTETGQQRQARWLEKPEVQVQIATERATDAAMREIGAPRLPGFD